MLPNHFHCTFTVNLDGHEISETERSFLMNWKAMRKARRRQQKRSLDQIPYYLSEPVSDPILLSSVPAPPTLPALPARQLPRRSKKTHHDIEKLPQITESEDSGMMDFKLPELAPYQSIIAQQEQLMNKLSGHQLTEKPWRTLGVLTEQ